MLKPILLFFLFLSSYLLSAQNDTFNYLKTGDKAPTFSAKDQNKQDVNLDSLLKKGKVVLVFYRGAWCPHCNRHMSNLQDSLSLITEKDVTLIAVTPEVDSSINESIKKTNAQFSIVHDSAYVIMKEYGVSFKVNQTTIFKYKLVGLDVEEANGNSDNILPVPATFIINQKGIIDYLHFDENYKKRLSVSELVKHL